MNRFIINGTIALVSTLLMASFAFSAPSRTEIKRLVVEEAEATRIPPSLALAVAKVESDFQAEALSHKGARGVMQIMPSTAELKFGVAADELWDARLNVQLGLDFLEQLIERYDGSWDLALSHYNGGTLLGTGKKARPHGHTRRYVETVLRWQRRYANQEKIWRLAKSAPRKDRWVPARTTGATPKTNRASAKSQAWHARDRRSVDFLSYFALDDFASGRVKRILGQRGTIEGIAPAVDRHSS